MLGLLRARDDCDVWVESGAGAPSFLRYPPDPTNVHVVFHPQIGVSYPGWVSKAYYPFLYGSAGGESVGAQFYWSFYKTSVAR